MFGNYWVCHMLTFDSMLSAHKFWSSVLVGSKEVSTSSKL